jgi:hypothetical protein
VKVATLAGMRFPGTGTLLGWVLLAAVAAHFGVSYHLAYADRAAGPARHPWALVIVPAAATAAVVVAWSWHVSFRALVTLVFVLTIWHYVKQAYGVARLGAALDGVRIGAGTNMVLRYSLYPLWLLSLVRLTTSGHNGYMFGYRVGADILPGWTLRLAELLCAAGLVTLAVAVGSLCRQSGRVVSGTVWAPHLAGFAWIAFAPSYQSAAAVLAATHGVQYLACAHRAERTWASERAQEQPALWMVSILAASAVGGLFATSWLAPLVAHFSGTTTSAVAVGLFVVLNLHHYAIDAVMWRSAGTHVRRMVAV